MDEKKRERFSDFKIRFYALVIVGLSLLVALAVLYTMRDTKKAEMKIAETLEFLQTQCDQYISLKTSDVAQEISILGDNTKELARSLKRHPEDLTEERLKEHLEEQNLEGVLVLDESLQPVLSCSAKGTQDVYTIWKDRMKQDDVKNLLEKPGQFYLERNETEQGESYNSVAVGRMDQKGVIFVYAKAKELEKDAADVLLADILKKYEFGTDGKLFITNGKQVVSSNDEELIGKNVEDLQLLQICSQNEKDSCNMIQGEGKAYYGCWTRYQDFYTLYAFYPQKDVYRERQIAVANAAVIYAIALVIMLYLYQKSAKKYVDELARQSEIVQAISKVYSANYVVDLENKKAEVIKAPPQIVEGMKKAGRISDLSNEMVLQYVAEPYREGFRQFVDADTMAERLAGAEYLTYTYRDCFDQWFLLILVPKRKDKNRTVTEVVLVERNITGQKEQEIEYQEKLIRSAQDARQANAAKTDFLRRISHDIRTPINGIRGMIEIGEYYADDLEKQAECREKIREASGFLLDLVNDVLDMNKLESGDVQMEMVPFDLKQLLNEVDSLMDVQAGTKGIKFCMKGHEGVHWNLVGSPLHLRQILINIVGNAVKYNKENGTIEVWTRELEEKDGRAVFEFTCKDTGIGMSEEFQKHIFEPFSQEQDSARTTYEGTGLGLPIVKKLVEQMEGTLGFTSVKGQGSTFVVKIPFQIDHQKQEQQSVSDDSGEAKCLAGANVLLVEDNKLNMEIAEFMLEQQGIHVTKAWNGREAVELFEQSEPGTYELILMDIMMPEMDGIQATKMIRAMEREDAEKVVILAMTANAFSDDIARNKAAGMNDQLSKPLDMDTLYEMIGKYL